MPVSIRAEFPMPKIFQMPILKEKNVFEINSGNFPTLN